MKQVNRIKILSVVFAIFAVLAIFSIQKNFSKSTVDLDEDKVSIEDTASVSRIIIVNKEGEQVLSRGKSGWIINGKYKTRELATAMLMIGLNQLQIKREVSDESRTRVVNLLKEKGAKVIIEYSGGKKELIFTSNENDVNSTYLLIPGEEAPYIAFVPGVPGDINNLFRFGEKDWRSRIVFYSQPNHIQSLKISYPHEPDSDVEINYKRGNFEVKGVNASDTSELYQFLSFFQNLQVSRFLDSSDSLISPYIKKQPFAIIELVDLNPEKSNILRIYKTLENQTEYYALLGSNNEPTAIRKDFLRHVLLKKNDFVKR
jgi:hypothetical protein